MNFATEEEKNKAIEEFDERTMDVTKLEEIMAAEIVPSDEKPETSENVPSEEPNPDVSQTENVPESQASEEKTEEPGTKKTESQESELDILKKQLAEKEEYIKTYLANTDNIRALEQKVTQLERTHSEQAAPEQKREVALRSSKLTDLKNKRAELLKKYPDTEARLAEEFMTEMSEIEAGLFDEMETLQHNLSLIKDQAETATSKADRYLVQKEEDAKQSRLQESQDQEILQIETFAKKTPQFQLSKPFKEVDEDYKEYQMEVSKIYLGREPKHLGEVTEAMNQLKRRSPGLMQRLKAAGVSEEPTMEMKKYLGLCELWDHWQGYRKDPLTNDYHYDDKGNPIPLTRYDPMTGKYVPDSYPSIEAAYNDKAAKDGFYTRQVIAAKIEGGKQVIQAMNKRDGGAVELGVNETSGGTVQAMEEAINKLNTIDEVEAMRNAQDGDPTLLNEYNSLAKQVGWPTVKDPLAI